MRILRRCSSFFGDRRLQKRDYLPGRMGKMVLRTIVSNSHSVDIHQSTSSLGTSTPCHLSSSDIFVRLLSLMVAALFVISSISHLANPYAFLSSIYSYKLVGKELVLLLALIVP